MEKDFVKYEDIDYQKLDKILDTIKFVTKGRKKKNQSRHIIRYGNVPCSFDTETTSTYANGQKVAFVYVWQFALTDKFYCYGRTLEDFKDLLGHISEYLGLDSQKALICYIHNLAFEYQFFRKIFEWSKVFSTKDRNPIQAMCSLGIEFRDSYILSGLSLKKVAENLTSHKVKKLVGDLDYSLVRTDITPLSEKELGYMLNDVVILIYYIEEQIALYGNIAKIPLTNTGRVRRAVREKAFSYLNRYLTIAQMDSLTLTPELYLKLKQAFAGGFTHANKNYVGKTMRNVQSMDFTSSYPTVLLSSNRYPMGKPLSYHFVSNEKFIKDIHNERLMFFFTVTFTDLVTKLDFENYLSVSKCFDTEEVTENNGRVWQADKLSVTICSIDYEIIEKCYDWSTIEFSDITMFTCNYLPDYMLESVIEFYLQKTTLKDVEGKEQEYMLYKGMLNSLYGMTVTDIAKPEIVYDNDTDTWGKEPLDLKKAILEYNGNEGRFLYYPWGVVCTALARQNLWSGILELKDDFVYSDTDSVKFINAGDHKEYFEKYNKEITEKLKAMCKAKGFTYDMLAPKTREGKIKPLGVWDNDGFYTYFRTLGAKRYVCIELKNGKSKFETTIAGLGKNAGAKYLLKISDNDPVKAISNFKIGMEVPAGETGKNTHTYIDDEFIGNITDYLGNTREVHSLSSVHLEQASFKMTMSDTFADFLANMVTSGEFEINGVKYE